MLSQSFFLLLHFLTWDPKRMRPEEEINIPQIVNTLTDPEQVSSLSPSISQFPLHILPLYLPLSFPLHTPSLSLSVYPFTFSLSIPEQVSRNIVANLVMTAGTVSDSSVMSGAAKGCPTQRKVVKHAWTPENSSLKTVH